MTESFKLNYRLNDIVMLIYVICQAIFVMFVGGHSLGMIIFFYLVAALFIGAISFIPLTEDLSPVQFIRAAYPIFLIILFYYVGDAQARILQIPPRDAFFNAMEKGLIGVYPTFALQRIMEIWLNNISSVLYCMGIALPILALTILYFNREMRLFVNFIFALTLGGTICLLVSSIVPVVGPYGALQDLYYLGIYGDVAEFISFYVGHFSAAYGSFPAIYFCVIAISAFYLWDFGKYYVYLTFAIMTSVFWGGIYLRYHYLLDGLIALVIAFIAVAAASFIYFRSKPDKPDFA
jgi:hypothetical protein